MVARPGTRARATRHTLQLWCARGAFDHHTCKVCAGENQGGAPLRGRRLGVVRVLVAQSPMRRPVSALNTWTCPELGDRDTVWPFVGGRRPSTRATIGLWSMVGSAPFGVP